MSRMWNCQGYIENMLLGQYAKSQIFLVRSTSQAFSQLRMRLEYRELYNSFVCIISHKFKKSKLRHHVALLMAKEKTKVNEINITFFAKTKNIDAMCNTDL
jgi:hypothetical protein